MNECIECGQPNAEDHHVIFRSHAPYMVKVKSNIIKLCSNHHRGNKSPHRCKEKDLEYKRALQAKYEKTFCNIYYTLEQIKLILNVSDSILKSITKTLTVHERGYERVQLITRLMGGKLYDTCD